MSETGRDIVMVNGIVTEGDHAPRIEIGTMDRPGLLNMDAEDATYLGVLLLKVAEQVKADASLVRWALYLQPDKQNFAASLMDSLREYRNQLEIDQKNRQEEP